MFEHLHYWSLRKAYFRTQQILKEIMEQKSGWEGKYGIVKRKDTWEEPTSCWVCNTSQIPASSSKNYQNVCISLEHSTTQRMKFVLSFDAAAQAPLLKSCWVGSEAEVAIKPWAVPPQMQSHSPWSCQASPGLPAVTADFRSNSNCQEVDCILFCWEGQTKPDPQHTLKSISK